MNLTAPTSIQQASVPAILSDADILLKSQTGSGKTLAFLIPVLQKIQENDYQADLRKKGTLCLVLSPTRELALQIYNVSKQLFCFYPYICVGSIMGGESVAKEKKRIKKGMNVLISTPGRLLEHLEKTKSFNYKYLRWLILDEADRLLDFGFENTILEILKYLDNPKQYTFNPATNKYYLPENNSNDKKQNDSDNDEKDDGKNNNPSQKNNPPQNTQNRVKRQTILVSATLEKGVLKIAESLLKNPLVIQESKDISSYFQNQEAAVDQDNKIEMEESVLPEGLRTFYLQVELRHRLVTLAAFLRAKIQTYSKHYGNNEKNENNNKIKIKSIHKLNKNLKQKKEKKRRIKAKSNIKGCCFYEYYCICRISLFIIYTPKCNLATFIKSI